MENILATMRDNFCQMTSLSKDTRDDVLAQMRGSFCKKTILKPVKKLGKQRKNYDEHKKEAKKIDSMVKIKEEPVSDDEKDKNENEKTVAIGLAKDMDSGNCLKHTNSLIMPKNGIEKEDIGLNIGERKEINQLIQQVKQENEMGDEPDVAPKSEAPEDVKTEELVVVWTDNPDADNNGILKFHKHFLELENSEYKENEDDDDGEDEEFNNVADDVVKVSDSDYVVKEHDDQNDIDDVNEIENKDKRRDIIIGQRELAFVLGQEHDPLEEWCSKNGGKSCFLCFNDERYQTKKCLLQHIKEFHCEVNLIGYRLKAEIYQEKVEKIFYLIDSNQDGFGLCIECYMVFYTAERAANHMRGHIKGSTHISMPRFHEFRSCCKGNSTVCRQPFIICGECRLHILRSDVSLTRHGRLHYKGPILRDCLPKKSDLFLSASIDSKDSSSSNNKNNAIMCAVKKRNIGEKCKMKYGNFRNAEIEIDKEKNNKSNRSYKRNTVLSEMQQKFCNTNDSTDNDIKEVLSANVNTVLSEMQQKFCNNTDSSEISSCNEKELPFQDSVYSYWNKNVDYLPQSVKLIGKMDDIDVMVVGKDNDRQTKEPYFRNNTTPSPLLAEVAAATETPTIEHMKTIANHSLKVDLKRIEWDCKSAEKKMQFLIDEEIKYKNQKSKKRKIIETISKSHLNEKSVFHKHIYTSLDDEIIVELESFKPNLENLEQYRIQFIKDYSVYPYETGLTLKEIKERLNMQYDEFGSKSMKVMDGLTKQHEKHSSPVKKAKRELSMKHNKTGLTSKNLKDGLTIQLDEKTGEEIMFRSNLWENQPQDDSFFCQEYVYWQRLSMEAKKQFVAERHAGRLFLHASAKVDIINKYISGTQLMDVCQQACVDYHRVRFWMERVLNSASEWLCKDKEDLDTKDVSSEKSNLSQEKNVWNTLSFDQKKRLVLTSEAGPLYIDESSRIKLLDKYLSGCTIEKLSRQTGCLLAQVRKWIIRMINDLSRKSNPDHDHNKKTVAERYYRVKTHRSQLRRQRALDEDQQQGSNISKLTKKKQVIGKG